MTRPHAMQELHGTLLSNPTTRTLLSFAQDLFAALGAPLGELAEHKTEEQHPGESPETIETRSWTDGARRIAVIVASDPRVAMESTDARTYAEIDGLPGDVSMRFRGDDFGQLRAFRVIGVEPHLTHVADAWLTVLAARTGSTPAWRDDPTLPPGWLRRVQALPRLSSRIEWVEVGAARSLTRQVPWTVHDVDGENWAFADARHDWPAIDELEVLGPLPRLLDSQRHNGGGPQRFDDHTSWLELFTAWTMNDSTPLVELEQESSGLFALRMRVGPRVLRAFGTRGGDATAYLQSESGELPLVRFDRTHGGRADGGASFGFLLVGERVAFPEHVESLRMWMGSLGLAFDRWSG